MSRWTAIFAIFLAAIIGPAVASGEPEPADLLRILPFESESLPALQGEVRDAKTGDAIAGAVVLVERRVHEQQTWNMHGYSRERCHAWQSAITDADGVYSVARKKLWVESGWDFETSVSRLWISAPGHAPVKVRAGSVVLLPPETKAFHLGAELPAALDACEQDDASFSEAAAGLAALFLRGDPKSPDYTERERLNFLGRLALRARFDDDWPRGLPATLTSEQIAVALSGDRATLDQQLALDAAVQGGDVAKVERLLRAGADANFDTGYRRSRRWHALTGGHMETYRVLVEHGATWRAGERGDALLVSAREGNVAALAQLLDEGVQVYDYHAELGDSPLLEAMQRSHASAVTLLLEAGANPDVKRPSGNAALFFALELESPEMFAQLLAHGADTDIEDRYGVPLFGRVHHRGVEYLRALLASGAKTGTLHNGFNPLGRAIIAGNEDMIALYLEHGADPAGEGLSPPFVAAAAKGRIDLLERMAAHPNVAAGSATWWQALNTAITRSDAATEFLLAMHAGALTQPPAKYACLLCIPSAKTGVSLARRLLDRGLPVNGRDPQTGSTALLGAARGGRLDVVELLLEYDADPAIANNEGVTALAFASDAGEKENRKVRAKYGTTPTTTIATSAGVPPTTVTLKDDDLQDRPSHEAPAAPITLTVMQPAGLTTLNAMQMVPRLETKPVLSALVARLLAAGAPVNAADADGWTPLMRAAARGEKRIVAMLLDAGADASLRNTDGETALEVAMRAGHAGLADAIRVSEAGR